MRGAEVAQNIPSYRGLLRADDEHMVPAEPGKTADHRAIFGKQAVAVQFLEIGEGFSK